MMNDDKYWKDSFETLGKAIDRLNEVLVYTELNDHSIIRDAVIKRFEFTIELFWKTSKKILHYEKVDATSPRDTLSKALLGK